MILLYGLAVKLLQTSIGPRLELEIPVFLLLCALQILINVLLYKTLLKKVF